MNTGEHKARRQADNASLYDTFNLRGIFGVTQMLTPRRDCRAFALLAGAMIWALLAAVCLLSSAIWLAVAVSVARLVG